MRSNMNPAFLSQSNEQVSNSQDQSNVQRSAVGKKRKANSLNDLVEKSKQDWSRELQRVPSAPEPLTTTSLLSRQFRELNIVDVDLTEDEVNLADMSHMINELLNYMRTTKVTKSYFTARPYLKKCLMGQPVAYEEYDELQLSPKRMWDVFLKALESGNEYVATLLWQNSSLKQRCKHYMAANTVIRTLGKHDMPDLIDEICKNVVGLDDVYSSKHPLIIVDMLNNLSSTTKTALVRNPGINKVLSEKISQFLNQTYEPIPMLASHHASIAQAFIASQQTGEIVHVVEQPISPSVSRFGKSG